MLLQLFSKEKDQAIHFWPRMKFFIRSHTHGNICLNCQIHFWIFLYAAIRGYMYNNSSNLLYIWLAYDCVWKISYAVKNELRGPFLLKIAVNNFHYIKSRDKIFTIKKIMNFCKTDSVGSRESKKFFARP